MLTQSNADIFRVMLDIMSTEQIIQAHDVEKLTFASKSVVEFHYINIRTRHLLIQVFCQKRFSEVPY